MTLHQSLAQIILHGMARVDRILRFTGPNEIEHTYITHFPMPDGREWELSLRLKRPKS